MKQQDIHEMYGNESPADIPAAAQLAALPMHECQETITPEPADPLPPYFPEAIPVQASSSRLESQGSSKYSLVNPIVVPRK